MAQKLPELVRLLYYPYMGIMSCAIFMISVDVIKHSEAHLTSKNRSSKNLLSCLEALYSVFKSYPNPIAYIATSQFQRRAFDVMAWICEVPAQI